MRDRHTSLGGFFVFSFATSSTPCWVCERELAYNRKGVGRSVEVVAPRTIGELWYISSTPCIQVAPGNGARGSGAGKNLSTLCRTVRGGKRSVLPRVWMPVEVTRDMKHSFGSS